MLIESVKPLKVKLPTGEVHLTLLAKAYGKVRMVPRTKPDWFQAWRELAALTYGITDQDPRFSPVMATLDQCDNAFLKGDWPAFQQAAERVRAAMQP